MHAGDTGEPTQVRRGRQSKHKIMAEQGGELCRGSRHTTHAEHQVGTGQHAGSGRRGRSGRSISWSTTEQGRVTHPEPLLCPSSPRETWTHRDRLFCDGDQVENLEYGRTLRCARSSFARLSIRHRIGRAMRLPANGAPVSTGAIRRQKLVGGSEGLLSGFPRFPSGGGSDTSSGPAPARPGT